MLKLKPSGFLFFASLIVMAQGSAWAQQDPMPLPEIQVDGSVLQGLAMPPANETPSQDLAPVKLVPPSLNRTAAPATGSLTMFETVEPDIIKPIITMTKAPEADKPKPAVVKTVEAPVPMRKPQIAATDKPVAFQIKAETKTVGGLNPATNQTATAPVQPGTTTSEALALSMAQRDVPAAQTQSVAQTAPPASWRQTNPKILYDHVPIPKPRPSIGMASASFVEQARENLVETYTIVKREGDRMPAIPKQKVAGEKLPAPRLSIADIAGDPLASRIVDMTPEEVAQALNNMAPASGHEKIHLARELSTVAKPRIVREMGEWNRKDNKNKDSSQIRKTTVSPGEDKTVVADDSLSRLLPPKTPAVKIQDVPVLELASLRATPSPDGTTSVNFKAGEVSLTKDATGTIDSLVVGALKSSPDSRIQIVAYAAAPDGKEGTARRTSLSRALSVRSYLISQGIDATRMDVRAMGIQTDQKAAADKVDMVLVTGKKS
jgi:outer membrane protein OmpA-like peptidoglycan-associated protein